MTQEDSTLAQSKDVSLNDIGGLLTKNSRPLWRKKRVLVPLGAFLAILAWAAFGGSGSDAQPYISQEVREGSLDLSVSATGGLRPTNQIQVGSEISGRIETILVDVNDRVEKGQVLAVINTEIIDDQIRLASANTRAAQAQVAQAEATLVASQAQIDRLEDVYQRSGGKVPSQVELDQARATATRDRAAVAATMANVAAQSAQLSSARVNRERAVIRAPASGVVIAREVEPGQTVIASFSTPTLFILAEDLAQMQLRVDVDEADVGQVQDGQQATFTVDAYPGRKFPAKVERVDLAASNIAAGSSSAGAVVTYQARLTVANGNGLLRPGMTATANIEVSRTDAGLIVPNSALRFDPDAGKVDPGEAMLNPDYGLDKQEQRASIGVGSRQTVHVLGDDGELEVVEVTTGASDGRSTLVTSDGLKPGIQIVIASGSGES